MCRVKGFESRRQNEERNFVLSTEMITCLYWMQDYSKLGTVVLAFQTLGVVFGGLGTSPLYVWPTIQLDSPNEDDFLGVMSLLFWTVTLIALVKYGLIILNADDHGEGSCFFHSIT